MNKETQKKLEKLQKEAEKNLDRTFKCALIAIFLGIASITIFFT